MSVKLLEIEDCYHLYTDVICELHSENYERRRRRAVCAAKTARATPLFYESFTTKLRETVRHRSEKLNIQKLYRSNCKYRLRQTPFGFIWIAMCGFNLEKFNLEKLKSINKSTKHKFDEFVALLGGQFVVQLLTMLQPAHSK